MGKHRTHILYCDTTLSTPATVYLNVYQNMILSAMKMHLYLKDLPGGVPQPGFVFGRPLRLGPCITSYAPQTP